MYRTPCYFQQSSSCTSLNQIMYLKEPTRKRFWWTFYSVIICSGYFEYVLNNSNAIMKWQLIFHTATESQNEMRFVEFNAWLSTYKSREFSDRKWIIANTRKERENEQSKKKKNKTAMTIKYLLFPVNQQYFNTEFFFCSINKSYNRKKLFKIITSTQNEFVFMV